MVVSFNIIGDRFEPLFVKVLMFFFLFQPHLLADKLPSLPMQLPAVGDKEQLRLSVGMQSSRLTTIDVELQNMLKRYIRKSGNPIAAVVVVEVKSGKILAMVQGLQPSKWGANEHTALYHGFPAASLFKTVGTAAALEVAKFEPDFALNLLGGCAVVHPRGRWFSEAPNKKNYKISLQRAFANSCNGFYAKLTMQHLGLANINEFARRFKWGKTIDSDFDVSPSPINIPDPVSSGVLSVGRYSAGFGMVGMSAVHAAWINLALANDGWSKPLQLFGDHKPSSVFSSEAPILSKSSSEKLRHMMKSTVRSGTAAGVFGSSRYRRIRSVAGGKTGTLTGFVPKGLTTWFAGVLPVDKPKVVVSAVVVNHDRWVIKGTHLAAEAFLLWKHLDKKRQKIQRMSKNKKIKKQERG